MTMSSVAGDVEGAGQPAHDVFVSYSTNDKPVADAIVSRLEQAGIRCWVAPRDIIPGRVWGEAILHAIEATRLMVVVLSGAANASRQVIREVERAVSNDVVVIPFRIESVEPTGAMAYFLASEHWLDAMTPPLESHIARLLVAVRALLGSVSPAEARARTADTIQPAPDIQATPAPRRAPSRTLIAGLVGAAAVVIVGLVGAVALAPSSPTPPSPSSAPPTPTSASASPSPATQSPSPATPSVTQEARLIPETALATGDCLLTPDAYDDTTSDQSRFWKTTLGTWPSTWGVVACDQRHGAEVFFVGDVWGPDATFPGDAAVEDRWNTQCRAEFEQYAGVVLDRSGLDMSGWPGYGADGWLQGLREMACIAFDRGGATLEGSIRGTAR